MTVSPDISILIPFLNEEENLPGLAAEVSSFVANHPEITFELLLINDGSTDQSQRVAGTLSFGLPTRMISLSRNFGSHAALRAGMLHARGEHVCFLYADLQDPIDNIIPMHALAKQGYDIIWGVRKSVAGGGMEKLFSRYYAYLMQRFVNNRFPEKGFDIVMFSAKVLQEMNRNVEANSSVFLQLLNLGYMQSEVHYDKKERKAGKSKWTLSKKIKLVVDSFVAFSYAPIRFVTLAGISMFMIGILWTTYIGIRKLVFNDLASGWAMLTSILFLGFGLTNISLGIMAEYLWRTLDASRKRPVFVIDKIIDMVNQKPQN